MAELKAMRRPGPALVKLVEAVGILLGTEKKLKSYYKVPVPSNYDNTLDVLEKDYQGTLDKLVNLQSLGISDVQASELYEKSLEPGFDYDEAIRNGGTRCRELFDVVMYLLNETQTDIHRYPVVTNNVYVIVSPTRESYLAIDVAAHLFNHGILATGVLNIFDPSDLNHTKSRNLSCEYTCIDVIRRFKNLYKLLDHRFQVETLQSNLDDAFETAKLAIEAHKSNIVVLGIYEDNFYDVLQQSLIQWLAWDSNITGIFVKSQSLPRPFEVVITPKSHMICIQCDNNINDIFAKSLTCMRSCDSFVALLLIDEPCPVGDIQRTRFSLGARSGWVNSTENPNEKAKNNWNSEIVTTAKQNVLNFLSQCQISGRLRIEIKKKFQSLSADINKYAIQENVEMIILNPIFGKDVIKQCIESANCTVAVVK